MKPDRLDHMRFSPQIDNQLRYLTVALTCSLAPIIVISLLHDPLRSALIPIAVLFAAHTIMYALALSLYGVEWLWQRLRPPPATILRCPGCRSVDQPYRPFYVTRVTAQLLRIECPECHERWIERG